MRYLIFGCAEVGIRVKKKLEQDGHCIIAFVDNDEKKWGTKVENIEVVSPIEIRQHQFDLIAIGLYKASSAIREQLIGMGIAPAKIQIPIQPPAKLFINALAIQEENLDILSEESNNCYNTKEYNSWGLEINDDVFLNKLDLLKKTLRENRIPRDCICIVSGAVLQAHKIRISKTFDDIDIIMTSNLREQYGDGLVIVSDIAEMHPKNENAICDDKLIRDTKYHFVFYGFKFLTLKMYYEFRKAKNPDDEELVLVEQFFRKRMLLEEYGV